MSFCSICLHDYVDPRVLSCGHSFCFQCLQSMRGNRRCPLCKKSITNSGDLPCNYALQDLCFRPATRHNCSSCRHVKELWCQECSQPICLVAQEDGWHPDHSLISLVEASAVLADKLREKNEEIQEELESLPVISFHEDRWIETLQEEIDKWREQRCSIFASCESQQKRIVQEKRRSLLKRSEQISVSIKTGVAEMVATLALPPLTPLSTQFPSNPLQKLNEEYYEKLDTILQNIVNVDHEFFTSGLVLIKPPELTIPSYPDSWRISNPTDEQIGERMSNPRKLRALLDSGLSPNYLLHDNPLIFHVIAEENWQGVSLLLSRNADVNVVSTDNRSIMETFFDTQPRYQEDVTLCIEYLVRKKAIMPSAEVINSRRWLLEAVKCGNGPLVRLLLRHGADPDVSRPIEGQLTARELAVEYDRDYFNHIPGRKI